MPSCSISSKGGRGSQFSNSSMMADRVRLSMRRELGDLSSFKPIKIRPPWALAKATISLLKLLTCALNSVCWSSAIGNINVVT